MKWLTPRATVMASCLAVTFSLAACGGAGGSGGSGGEDTQTLRVLMINPPQMEELAKLTEEHFTKETGIKVEFTALPENDMRDKLTQEFSSQAGQYDVASMSAYEVPMYANNGWLAPLDDFVAEDDEFDQDDVFPSLTDLLKGEDGNLYAEPFFAEGSFLMYRKDVLQELGLTMPEKPTWTEVDEIARKISASDQDMAGICLRGLSGWGQNLAALTTVVNTFGGQWFNADWDAQLTQPEFKEATQFYTDLAREAGPPGAAQNGVLECLNIVTQGKAAMIYDATSLASQFEAEDSPVKGKMGYAAAPVEETDSSSWLWTWAWGIQKASPNQEAAWKWISWASSAEYEQLVGEELGWAKVPAGKRASLYEIPEYIEATEAFSIMERDAVLNTDPTNPGVNPQPYTGVQYVGIPEFPDLGTKVSEHISAVIAGKETVDEALEASQELAEPVGDKHQD